MATSTASEYILLPKKRFLDKASGESRSFVRRRTPFYMFNPYHDDCLRQYISYYYQFQRSQGFDIDWDKLDYTFDTMPTYEWYLFSDKKTNSELIRDVACRAISHYNSEKGARLVFLDHVTASYQNCSDMVFWITFWAMDLASSCQEPKIYQTQCRPYGPTSCEVSIFRVKPTDEEIAAVKVDPPPPLYLDTQEYPTIFFTVTGPGSGFIPDIVFTRVPAENHVSTNLY